MKPAPSETLNENFRLWLQKQFTDKCRKNSSFSLRSFARILDTDASTVSQILAGKRNVSIKAIGKICDRLSVTPELRAALLRKDKAAGEGPGYQQLTADAFAVIADWYHYAILELTFTTGFKSDPKWIAQKLGITQAEATIAIERLERLELIELRRGRLVKTDAFLTNYEEGFTAPALRELQRQILQKALHAIDFTPPEDKDITSITMAVDPALLPEARRRLKSFRRDLCFFLEKGRRTRVYHLGLQLYPVSLPSTQKENV